MTATPRVRAPRWLAIALPVVFVASALLCWWQFIGSRTLAVGQCVAQQPPSSVVAVDCRAQSAEFVVLSTIPGVTLEQSRGGDLCADQPASTAQYWRAQTPFLSEGTVVCLGEVSAG